jgi:hypothetical protein
MSDPASWSDVERLISDLKNDGYEPTDLKGIPSGARKKKQIYLSVERDAEGGDDA